MGGDDSGRDPAGRTQRTRPAPRSAPARRCPFILSGHAGGAPALAGPAAPVVVVVVDAAAATSGPGGRGPCRPPRPPPLSPSPLASFRRTRPGPAGLGVRRARGPLPGGPLSVRRLGRRSAGAASAAPGMARGCRGVPPAADREAGVPSPTGRCPWPAARPGAAQAGRGSGGSGSAARAGSLIAWGVRDPARGSGRPRSPPTRWRDGSAPAPAHCAGPVRVLAPAGRSGAGRGPHDKGGPPPRRPWVCGARPCRRPGGPGPAARRRSDPIRFAAALPGRPAPTSPAVRSQPPDRALAASRRGGPGPRRGERSTVRVSSRTYATARADRPAPVRRDAGARCPAPHRPAPPLCSLALPGRAGPAPFRQRPGPGPPTGPWLRFSPGEGQCPGRRMALVCVWYPRVGDPAGRPPPARRGSRGPPPGTAPHRSVKPVLLGGRRPGGSPPLCPPGRGPRLSGEVAPGARCATASPAGPFLMFFLRFLCFSLSGVSARAPPPPYIGRNHGRGGRGAVAPRSCR